MIEQSKRRLLHRSLSFYRLSIEQTVANNVTVVMQNIKICNRTDRSVYKYGFLVLNK